MNEKALEFAASCLEIVAEELGLRGDEVFKLLTEKSDILDSYIIPNYDSLHTKQNQDIAKDIIKVMRDKGTI